MRRLFVIVMVAMCSTACGSDGQPIRAQGRPPTSAATEAVETPITSPPTVTTSVQPRPRALIVGDSTLMSVERYGALDDLRGFDYVFSAESCRTLGVPSCGDPPIPPNAVETITAAEGPFDVVVVMAGYDEWWTSFPSSFDRVVESARLQGADHVIWLTYREGVGYVAPDGASANEAFVRNNQTLRNKVTLPQFADVVLADWFTYSAESTDWLTRDGIHLTRTGAGSVADYISRKLAFVEGLPCADAAASEPPVETSCPDPDLGS